MTRAVDSPIIVPTNQALAVSEVVDTTGTTRKGGGEYLARCMNTLYEQKRGSLVMDGDYPLMSGNGEQLFYRCRQLGNANLTDETALFRVYLRGATGSGSIVVTDAESGDTATYSWSGGPADAWHAAADTLTLEDGATSGKDYVDLTVDLTISSGVAYIDALGIFYERAKSSLTAVSAGEDGYGNDFVPSEPLRFIGEAPYSVARLQDIASGLIHIYESRVAQIVASATPSGWTPLADRRIWTDTPCALGGAATARFWLYAEQNAGATDSYQFSSPYDDDSISITGGKAWYGPADVSVDVPIEGAQRPSLTDFLIHRTGVDAAASVYSVCGWWRDVSYG